MCVGVGSSDLPTSVRAPPSNVIKPVSTLIVLINYGIFAMRNYSYVLKISHCVYHYRFAVLRYLSSPPLIKITQKTSPDPSAFDDFLSRNSHSIANQVILQRENLSYK